MSFAEVVGPAIEMAEQGFPVYRYFAAKLEETLGDYQRWPSSAEIFLPGGRPPLPGEMFFQKDLRATLRQIVAAEEAHQAEGRERALKAARDLVYKGELAETIVTFCRDQGGLLTMDDLAEYQARWEPPVMVNYRGYQVYACGPWGQGPVFPQALKLVEGIDLRSMGHNSAEYIHTLSQSLNLAFADREQYIGDPAFVDVPMDGLLSEAYLRERRTLIDPDRAWPEMPPAGDPRNCRATLEGAAQAVATPEPVGDQGADTSYFGVIDKDGNIISCTPSEGTLSGGGPIIPGTGLSFPLRGCQSKVQHGHPAAIAPGKRPRLTPAPALVLRDGQPVMAIGSHGGDHIPQGMLQLFLNVVEFGFDPQEAVEEPRFYSYNFPSSLSQSVYLPGVVRLEGRISEDVVSALQRPGHKVDMYPDWWEGSGLYGVITLNPDTGVLQGGADPRCEAYSVGY